MRKPIRFVESLVTRVERRVRDEFRKTALRFDGWCVSLDGRFVEFDYHFDCESGRYEPSLVAMEKDMLSILGFSLSNLFQKVEIVNSAYRDDCPDDLAWLRFKCQLETEEVYRYG